MNNIDIEQREMFLEKVILDAGKLALEGFNSSSENSFTLKKGQDFLTETDSKVEQFIRNSIHQTFPDDSILGEELGEDSSARKNDNLWVIDPIDGTANFARKIPHFCCTISFVYKGNTVLGAIYNPCSNELYFAKKEAYCKKNGELITVSNISDLDAATIEFGWNRNVSFADYLSTYQQLLEKGFNVRRGGSGALALAWVAEGRTDGYLELSMNSWDCLAGLLMIREAGGVTGDYPSSLEQIFSPSVVAGTNVHMITHVAEVCIKPIKLFNLNSKN
ncbi:inositol monophosphatase family protein [Thorsellia kenyensis]|uniref:Inositol-1-monophosphatase n=1 Tax=Thorsellia kenyensis TaxID=1549888 RepID=A0ABV6C837_9GAMM